MKIAVDWDTVVTTDEELWRAFVKEAQFRGHDVKVMGSRNSNALEEFCAHLWTAPVIIDEVVQAQEVVSADVWVHGRLDRVVSHHVAEHVINK